MFDDLFGLEKDHKIAFGDNVDLLTTVYDEGALAVVRSILEGEEIPYLAKERGSGSAMRIMTGFTMFGTDIYVPVEKLELAKQLIAPLPEDTVLEEELQEEDTSADADTEL